MTRTTDGRLLRGVRTRSSIVQALLDLITDGVPSPTAAQIAENAGVSVRSVFQHFEDLEALYADLVAVQAGRIAPLVASLQGGDDTDARIAAVVDQRRELYETITPVRRAIAHRADTSPVLRQRLDDLDAELRRQLERQFHAELATRPGVIESVDLVASFAAWDRLRRIQGLDSGSAADTLRDALTRLLR